jgi:hypothetical protein
MKQVLFLAVFIGFAINSYGQSLGNYSTTSVIAGRNITVTPTATPIGAARITVTTSTNFTGLLNANLITGKITITDAKPVGSYSIKVRAYTSSGATTSKVFTLKVTNTDCSDGEFGGNTNLTGFGQNLVNIAIGDFNKDGKQDFITANMGNDDVSVRLGNGSGGFTNPGSEGVTNHPYAVAIGDFDNDGDQDFLTTCQGNNLVAVRRGDGSGGFGSSPNVLVGAGPVGIAVGDFNEDGKQDFATANLNGHKVSVRFGAGNGDFSGNVEIPVAQYPYSIVIGDFDEDGHQDFATASGGNSSISIRFGNGSGGFSGNTEIAVGLNPYSVAIGDFNGDGHQDLVSANYSTNNLSIRLGDGNGNFSGSTDVGVGANPYNVCVGNFNGDNFQDLACTNFLSNTVSIRIGDGNGNFSGNVEVNVGSYPISMGVGDFNNDKKQDIAVSNYQDNTVSIRLGQTGDPASETALANSPVCFGQNIMLNTTGGSDFTWTGPNNFGSSDSNPQIMNATYADTGYYQVTLTNSNNCTGTSSVYVGLNPLPEAEWTIYEDSICYGTYVNLFGGTPGGGYFAGPGVVSTIFDSNHAGIGEFTLMYVYTDINGCSDTAKDKMHVFVCTDVSENNFPGINIYPNPVKNILRIDNLTTSVNSVELFSSEGRLVKQWNEKFISGKDFDVSEINAGIYFVKISSDNFIRTVKICKEY